MAKVEAGPAGQGRSDGVAVAPWLAAYAAIFLAAAAALVLLSQADGWTLQQWRSHPAETFARTGSGIKLLVFGLYLSLCTSFLPLPTGWIVAALATRHAAVAVGLADGVPAVAAMTTVIVGLVGAAGSTVANLNEYHLLTWMLRSRRLAAMRDRRSYQAAARWFARSPFLLLTVFNFLPLPVDVVRWLAISHRYPRATFAAANFLGRFVRYGVIAFVTFWFDLEWVAVVALLAIAVIMLAARAAMSVLRRAPRPANADTDVASGGVS